MPTGECFCGCGGEAEIGRFFIRGHDITAGAALRAVEGGLTLPQRLAAAGYGPQRSVVQEAVERAGWARCAGCAYAGAPAGLAAHVRGGGCEGAGPAEPEPRPGPEGDGELEGGARAAAGGPAAPAPSGEDRKGRTRRPGGPGGSGGEEAGPVRIEAGVARGLLVPGPADEVWRKVPLALRQDLSVAAHRLVSPEQPVLREKENRSVRYALRAADGMRMGGKHWLALLGAPRESFGSARSERAGRMFEVLEQVVAEYVAPAVAGPTAPAQDAAAAPERAAAAVDELDVSGAGPGAGGDAVAPQDAAVEGSAAAPEPGEAGLEPADDVPSEPAGSSSTSSTSTSASSGSVVETGTAEGRVLAGADDPVWGEVPLHLRQSLRGIARQLVTPVRGVLREPEQRRVLSAVRAAERMKLSGAHWVLLMTTQREAFGGSGSAMAGAFYKALEQVLAEFPPLTRPQDDPAPEGSAAPEEAPASVGAGAG
ncbi:hypothetical protein AB0393_38910 [Streptomyces cyaneofuscatus]|uniref:hypothetical protein n=1 Tax=Streptomyces cyaneofuscatus TaxID=66883 RepID=UPI00344BA937